ncbi:MAG: hypothetical protein KDA21_01980 [Phycisphaerales bacterium]|nr:hypothetical protein [Phycisphaerales bacterium]
MDEYEQLERMIAEGREDYQKALGGNKAAGTRVRKQMQTVKNQAQVIRQKMLEVREDEK